MLSKMISKKCRTIAKPLHTERDSYYDEFELDGTTEYIFILNFIEMLDKAIVNDNYKYLSTIQEKVLKRYFIDANLKVLSDYNKPK